MKSIYEAAIDSLAYLDEDGIKRVTAEDLRGLGFSVPDSIPDVGNVPAQSIVVSCESEQTSSVAINLKISLEFLKPFEWINMTMTIPK